MIREFFASSRDSLLSPDSVLDALQIQFNSSNLHIPDRRSWKLVPNGSFSVKSLYRFLADRGTRCNVTPHIFKSTSPCKINAFICLVWDQKILMLDKLLARDCNKVPSATCVLCHSAIKSGDHLFFYCSVTNSIWCCFACILSFLHSSRSCFDLWGP